MREDEIVLQDHHRFDGLDRRQMILLTGSWCQDEFDVLELTRAFQAIVLHRVERSRMMGLSAYAWTGIGGRLAMGTPDVMGENPS